MRTFRPRMCLLVALLSVFLAADAAAQATSSPPPTLIPLLGEVKTSTGDPRTGTVLLVISLYDAKDDSAPRWIEHQVITLDQTGRYEIQFGATRDEGLPPDLFSSGAGVRWVGVAVENEPEQPRVTLVSVPYAAKAGTADTLAGKSANDFVLTTSLTDEVKAVLREEETSASATAEPGASAVTENFLQKGTSSSTTTDSAVIEVSGNVGIGTAVPRARLHVHSDYFIRLSNSTAAADGFLGGFEFANTNAEGPAVSSRVIGLRGSSELTGQVVFETRDGASLTEKLRITSSGNVGIGTITPSSKLHVAGNVTVDGNIGAKYQDVAEWVDSIGRLDPGTVVTIDTSTKNRVKTASRPYDSRVAGAVSAQPGVVLGEPGEGKALVAQSGRVRIKADARFGAIRTGDLLVTSSTAGHAMRSRPVNIGGQQMHRPGTLIGKALEPLPTGRGEILVLLTLQ